VKGARFDIRGWMTSRLAILSDGRYEDERRMFRKDLTGGNRWERVSFSLQAASEGAGQ
jgi:hypothetical protein